MAKKSDDIRQRIIRGMQRRPDLNWAFEPPEDIATSVLRLKNPVPDDPNDPLAAVPAVVAPPPPEASQENLTARLPSIVPEGETPEQRAVAEAGRAAKNLMARDRRFLEVQIAMITWRRCYAVAYRELQDLLAEQENLPPMTKDMLIGSAMFQAQQQFDEHAMVNNLVSTVMPWLGGVIDKHIVLEQEIAKREAEEKSTKRRETPVPIGFKFHNEQAEAGLPRDRGLVLVGYDKALLWLMDQVVNNVLVARDSDIYTVVRLMQTPPKKGDAHKYLIRLGAKSWSGCCNSSKSMAVKVGGNIIDQLSSVPDLLICDDMAEAFTAAWTGRSAAASAGDAYKHFKRWCGGQDCAFLGLVPTQEKNVPDTTTPEWEQLRMFTHLVPVAVTDAPDDPASYHVVIGKFATVLTVPKEIVDGYGKTIIVTA